MSKSSPCRRQPSAAIRDCSAIPVYPGLSDPKSAENRLPGALSDMTLSSNRTSASGGRKPISTPSASQAVGCRGIEAGGPQRGRPIVAQVDAHRAVLGGGHGAESGQRRGLELDHLGLVDFVHGGPRRPGKPVRPRVQPRRHDDDLPHARGGGLGEVVVVVAGASGEGVDHPRKVDALLDVVGFQLAGSQPGEHVQPDGADQRLGELIGDDRLRTSGRGRSGRGDHGGGGSHAAGQVPGVTLGSCHESPR